MPASSLAMLSALGQCSLLRCLATVPVLPALCPGVRFPGPPARGGTGSCSATARAPEKATGPVPVSHWHHSGQHICYAALLEFASVSHERPKLGQKLAGIRIANTTIVVWVRAG
jgi:hypothetical protein